MNSVGTNELIRNSHYPVGSNGYFTVTTLIRPASPFTQQASQNILTQHLSDHPFLLLGSLQPFGPLDPTTRCPNTLGVKKGLRPKYNIIPGIDLLKEKKKEINIFGPPLGLG